MIELNKIYNEDCLEGMKRIPDEYVNLLVTDPPYKLTKRGNCGNMSGYWVEELTLQGKVFSNNDIDIESYINELFRILKDDSHCYIMCNNLNLPHFLDVIDKSEFKFIKNLIWDKQKKICGRYYMNQFEYIIMLRKGKERTVNNCGIGDILSISAAKTKKKNGENIHNSEKPISLMQILITQSTDAGDIVLDPFMGSGTTAIACMNTNRNFIGFELNKEYYDIANRRIEENKMKLF